MYGAHNALNGQLLSESSARMSTKILWPSWCFMEQIFLPFFDFAALDPFPSVDSLIICYLEKSEPKYIREDILVIWFDLSVISQVFPTVGNNPASWNVSWSYHGYKLYVYYRKLIFFAGAFFLMYLRAVYPQIGAGIIRLIVSFGEKIPDCAPDRKSIVINRAAIRDARPWIRRNECCNRETRSAGCVAARLSVRPSVRLPCPLRLRYRRKAAWIQERQFEASADELYRRPFTGRTSIVESLTRLGSVRRPLVSAGGATWTAPSPAALTDTRPSLQKKNLPNFFSFAWNSFDHRRM